MKLNFLKYQGTGNDFVMVDAWNDVMVLSNDQVAFLCDRRFGVGADGLMIIRRHPELDFEMIYYNADGAPGSMCGNGGRCIVRYAFDQGYIGKETRFMASDGPHEALVIDPLTVSLKMAEVQQVEERGKDLFLNTGSPHYIRFAEHADLLNIEEEGRKIRYNDEFREKGTNVNFVEQRGTELFVRTYERGVEAETLSCGTGVTASALAMAYVNKTEGSSSTGIITPGGQLKIKYNYKDNRFTDIWLEGPATFVYKGTIEI